MLEGKKKFTAYLVGVISSVFGLLVTLGVIGEGTAEAATSVMAVIAPIIGAALYDWFQSRHDIAREYARAQMQMGQMQAAGQTPQASVPPEPRPQAPAEFNEAEFVSAVHHQALEQAKKDFPEAPDWLINIFRAAEIIGMKTPCTDIRQALAYWHYLAGLAEDAWKQLEFETKDPGGCKLFPPQLYEARANFRRVSACLDNLQS